ncbi:ABC transporter ATP-binding protein [Streptococcus pluranimalium]|uniref:ABC transporter ATP-binding protein n=1 Tax=Streptococcus pluranimalium TaxID=82348 RepID=UPI00136C1205|nr:ABC transporter ATP-binding protein [Streptococcus pluranimalium]MXQ48883.1 ATP-binding cassette domain-containing protein [Streptococcus pneumoniae]HEM6116857.1 ABC transporter ATP-binding protein [Streptococcus suis]
MLKIDHLVGGYVNIPVLKDISFEVSSGEVVGLIGLNGAGKSTTISEIIGLLQPYQGSVTLDGLQLLENPESYRRKIGYIPETPILYEELTLQEHLDTVALAYGLGEQQELRQRLLQLFRLEDKLDWYPINFSKGMKQKVMIIAALMIEPSLLIVDEPFLGLDPLAIRDLTTIIAEEKAKGTAVLMSTHVLDSAEKMCDRFVILHHGEILANGSLEELRQQFSLPTADLTDIYMQLTQEN